MIFSLYHSLVFLRTSREVLGYHRSSFLALEMSEHLRFGSSVGRGKTDLYFFHNHFLFLISYALQIFRFDIEKNNGFCVGMKNNKSVNIANLDQKKIIIKRIKKAQR